jgi:hypothetical protein
MVRRVLAKTRPMVPATSTSPTESALLARSIARFLPTALIHAPDAGLVRRVLVNTRPMVCATSTSKTENALLAWSIATFLPTAPLVNAPAVGPVHKVIAKTRRMVFVTTSTPTGTALRPQNIVTLVTRLIATTTMLARRILAAVESARIQALATTPIVLQIPHVMLGVSLIRRIALTGSTTTATDRSTATTPIVMRIPHVMLGVSPTTIIRRTPAIGAHLKVCCAIIPPRWNLRHVTCDYTEKSNPSYFA